MAEADSTLEIQIRLLAETHGAAEVQAALNKTKEATSETGRATGKLAEAVKDGSKAAEKSEISHRALHGILHLIGTEAGPAAGAALSGVAAAATGGMLFAVMGVRELFEWLHTAADEAKQFKAAMEAKIDISGLVGGINDVKDAVDKTAKGIDDFFANLNSKAAGENGFKKIADDQLAHLQRVAEAEKKLAGEEAEREKARLDILKEQHRITEEEYKAGVKAADDLKGKKESTITGQLESQSVVALSQALTNIFARLEAAKRDLNGAKGAPNAEKHLDTLKGLVEATQTQIQKVQEVQNAPHSFMSAYGSALLNSFQHPTETSDEFRQRISDELGGKMNELRAQEASLWKQIEETKKTAPNPDKIKAIEDTITGLDSDRSSIQGELAKRKDQGAVDKDAGAAGQVQKFIEAQSRLLKHQGSGEDSQMVAAMNQMLQTTRQSDNRMFLLIKDLIAHKGDLGAALEDLRRQLANTNSRTSRPPT